LRLPDVAAYQSAAPEAAMNRKLLRPIMLGIGLLMLGYMLAGLLREQRFLIDAEQAEGMVIDLRKLAGSATVPVIRFTTEHGETVDWASSREAGGSSGYQVGDKVTLLYLPDNPSAAVIGSTFGIFGRFLLIGAAGLILVMRGLGATRSWRRVRR
jgi:hypothetical protein